MRISRSPSLPAAAGRRNFGDFLSQYLPALPGTYVDVDSGQRLGPCPDLHAVTHGQRPGIGGAHDRVYCVGKDVVRVGFLLVGGFGSQCLSYGRLLLLYNIKWVEYRGAVLDGNE